MSRNIQSAIFAGVLVAAVAVQGAYSQSSPPTKNAAAPVKLAVPEMEKVGKLRQSSTAIAGMSYWMAFSNSGRRVRPGDRVNVTIGNFHAMNLVVE